MRNLILVFIAVVSQLAHAEERVVEVITVYNRPAEDIQPLLQPMLEVNDAIVTNGNSLIVKTTADRLPGIANLIQKLDTPIVNLQISVIQSREVSAQQLNAGLNVDIHSGYAYSGSVNSAARGYIQQNQGQSDHQNTQIIRTLDGNTAYIKAGQVVPITNYHTYRDGYGYPNVDRSTSYVDATTGFAVTPRVVGQQVVMDVAPWSDRYGGYGQIQTQSAETSIRANLGEWVEIGGVNETIRANGSGIINYNQQSGQNNLRILVKVEVVN
jgi:type II secretory pathway component GspD/PulD (secretin)